MDLRKELRLLRRISTLVLTDQPSVLLPSGRVIETFSTLVDEIGSVFEAADVSIFLGVGPLPTDEFVLKAAWGISADAAAGMRIRAGQGLEGAAIAEQRIISVADPTSDPRCIFRREAPERKSRGFLAAPILRKEEAIGVIVLHFPTPRIATHDELRLMAAITEQFAIAIDNASLYEEVRDRMSEMISLYQVSRSLTKTLDLKSLLGEIVSQTMRVIPCRAVILRSLDVALNQLVVEATAQSGTAGLDRGLAPVEFGFGVSGRVAAEGKAVFQNSAQETAEYGRVSLLAIPLQYHDRVVGTLELIDRNDGRNFTESDAQMLSIFGLSAGEAYSRSELYAEMESLALNYMRKNRELTIFNQISREIQGNISEDEIFYIILTGITSGHGLGYNRAVAFFLDESGKGLRGAFGIGATFEAVDSVWTEAREKFRTLGDYFKNADAATIRSPFNDLVKSLRIPLSDDRSIFFRAINERICFNIRDTNDLRGEDAQFSSALRTSAFAVVPICTRDLVIGVIVVDNCFTKKPIAQEELVLLETVANQCGLALSSAMVVKELSDAMIKLEVTTERLLEAERYAAIGEVAAGVAHDIRNPLTSIGGFTRRIGKRLPPGDMGHTYVEIVEKEVRRLETLATEILELAIEKRPAPVFMDLRDLLADWKAMHEYSLHTKGAECIVESEPLIVKADRWLMNRAVSNILLNALDAIPDRGRIACRGFDAESAVILEIEDTGPGIPEDQIEKIFEPFYSTKTEGTGLGLALAKKAVLAHKGSIEAHKSSQGGMILKITLPKHATA